MALVRMFVPTDITSGDSIDFLTDAMMTSVVKIPHHPISKLGKVRNLVARKKLLSCIEGLVHHGSRRCICGLRRIARDQPDD